MWKNGTELVHLEWEDFAEEILATVYPKTFVDKSVRITSADVSADATQATLETGLKNVQAIIKMASKSKWYKSIPVERLQEMATHGLIIHPTEPDYLTCDHHARQGKHICWPSAEPLEAHFDAIHTHIYDEWRCQNAGERMATIEEICPSIDAPLSGVWADPVLLPPMAMPRDPMAMPSPTAAASSSPSTSRTAAFPPPVCRNCDRQQIMPSFLKFCQHCGAPWSVDPTTIAGLSVPPVPPAPRAPAGEASDALSLQNLHTGELARPTCAACGLRVPGGAGGRASRICPRCQAQELVTQGPMRVHSPKLPSGWVVVSPSASAAAVDPMPVRASPAELPPDASAPEAMDVEAVRVVEKPASVVAASDEAPLAAAAEADSSVPPAAAGASEAMDMDEVRAVEERKSVDAASDEVPLAAAAEADSSVPPAAAGASEAMDMDEVRAVEERKSVDAASDEVPLDSDPPDEDHTHGDISLWQWMIYYAQFQCGAQTLLAPAYQHDIEILSQLCQTALNAMVSAAPRSDLEYCQTAKGQPGNMLLIVSFCTLRHGMPQS